ncbi:MAG: carbohydrate binding domain-containing protein [Armatimonadetes bacterium]|nr:carbohydrate binding domain-containing protein [Armatimonadota bacterium]
MKVAILVCFGVVVAATSALTAQQTRRAEICLNGVWKFMPAVGPALREPLPDEKAWGLIRVPGCFAGWGVPGIVKRGEGEVWNKFNESVGRGWYERVIKIPSDWAGKTVVLEFQRIGTDGLVFVDGKKCGVVKWPGGEVDITEFVKPGQTVTLRVLVVAASRDEQVAEMFEGKTVNHNLRRGSQWACGLTGEVFLRCRPKGAHISDVFVQTSVRRKELTVSLELANVAQSGKAVCVAYVLDERGREERQFRAQMELKPAPKQTVKFVWRWSNPRLWDLRQPNLYTLHLRIIGAGVDDEWRQVFGFREFWIEGKRFFLNGKEIRLRPACLPDEWTIYSGAVEYIDGVLEGLMKAGFNIGEQWPWDSYERGRIDFRHLWAERADLKGFLIIGALPSMQPFLFEAGWRLAWDEKRKSAWEERVLRELKRLRNHPSIVIWATTANLFGMNQDQNPLLIGRKGLRTDAVAKAGREGLEIVKRHDPTRPIFTHHGADVGDLHTVNMYLNLIPLQEREEWLSEWVKSGDLPFMCIEFGTPFHATFLRGRNGFSNAIFTEPLATEFCAIYFGSKAYLSETPSYRHRIVKSFQGGQRYSSWHGARELMELPPFQLIQALFIRNTWRSWRTWGITGGMVPWEMEPQLWRRNREIADQTVKVSWTDGKRGAHFDELPRWAMHYLQPEGGFEPLPGGKAFLEVNADTLAWIAGPKGAFTSKDWHFFGGEKVQKQIVLINDSRFEQPFEAFWAVEVDGKAIARWQQKGTLKVAEAKFIPFQFVAPNVARKTDGKIRARVRIGKSEHQDEFPFRLYPKPQRTSLPPVLVFDPEGETTKLLKAVGIETQQWDGSFKNAVLIVGRKALERGQLPNSVKEFVARGGRAVIFGQDPEWLREAMGFRVARHVSRRVFVVPSQANHPIVRGLDDFDFFDWRGEGTLVPKFWGGVDEYPNSDPPFGWHWGNRGSVTSAAIEKPHRSGWTPVLECEFDLAYTPLMELHYGKGIAIWCTLDLEGRTDKEPVAIELTKRIVQYAQTAKVKPRMETFYIGDGGGEKLLKLLGVRFQKTAQLPSHPALVIVGGETKVSDQTLREFLTSGGRVLFLPRTDDLPFGFQAEVKPFGGAREIPSWEECVGLSLSDLRLRADIEVPVFVSAREGEIGANGLLGRVKIGKGVAILISLTPEMLLTKERTYLRFSAWRLTRTLSQLLANLGASFETDELSLEFGWHKRQPTFVPKEKELLRNNDFAQGLSEWVTEQHGTAKAKFEVVGEVPSPLKGLARAVQIEVVQPSDTGWHVQFNQRSISVKAGVTYLLSFWAKARRPCAITVNIQRAGDDYAGLGLWESVRLTTEWRLFRFRFVATRDEGNARLNFTDLARQANVYWLALPSLSVETEGGDVPLGFYHPDYLEGQELGDDPYRYYRW